ncbi:MAG: DUF58 domain-containing protein [Methylocystis sp.]|uniref:DUF58 domain-containing protein n=1 Tax=Methylocystis sp. TaxID=1911079 RepID=UPI003DA6882B
MIPSYAKPFTYAIPWRSSSVHFGGHKGTQRGLGFEYRGNVPLVDYPDARRMDLRQSLRDPFEQVQVRLHNQDNTTPVFAVCDLSGSMQYAGRRRKLDIAREIAASAACSAHEAGDLFGFVGYHSQVEEPLLLPLGAHVHQAFEIIEQLGDFRRLNVGPQGILEVPQYLSQHRGLVFWISDFHMPLELIAEAFNMMSMHQVIPVVLWDEREYKALPRFGFGNLIDPETGRNRVILFREAVRAQFEAAFAARREALEDMFERFDSPGHFIEGDFDADAMSHYFEQYMSL